VQGNCLEVLKSFPSESVDFVMTSPPYWGLRCYGKETETIWGGDANCQHEWIEETKEWHEGTRAGEKQLTNRGSFHNDAISQHGFCVKCGAWRGQLGLEPHPMLYVEHLVMICRELKRVLKKTGSMYIVMVTRLLEATVEKAMLLSSEILGVRKLPKSCIISLVLKQNDLRKIGLDLSNS